MDHEGNKKQERKKEKMSIARSKISHLVRSHVRLLREVLAANFTLVLLLLRVYHLVSVQIATLGERLVALRTRVTVDVSAQ